MTINSTNLQKRQQRSQHSFSWRALNIFLVASGLALGIVYLVGMNDLTVKGFVLKDLKSQTNMLAETNQDLQAKALALQSYAAISPRLQDLNMVEVEDIAYLSPKEAVVAKK